MTERPSEGAPSKAGSGQSMHSFAGAHDFTIGQQFNTSQSSSLSVTNHHHHYHSDHRGALVDRLDPCLDASYLRNRRSHPPDSICLPGTREGVLERIKTWGDGGMLLKDNPCHVMWVKGALGTGKSAIAQTIANMFAKKGRLAASFFFFCDSEDRSHCAMLARTLASQLCGVVPLTKPHMESSLEKHGGLLTTGSTSWQLQYLFLEPFRASFSGPRRLFTEPYIAVIDGIDECEDRGQVAEFLNQILTFFTEYPRTPLRFFLSSSAPSHIRTPIVKSEAQIVDLDEPASKKDLTILLNETFENAARDGKIRMPSYGWPTGKDRESLVHSAQGSFGELAAILRFIVEPSSDQTSPEDRLAFILDISQSSVSVNMDQMFMRILTPIQDIPESHTVLSTIASAKHGISAIQISQLRTIPQRYVHSVLDSLHAVLDIPEVTDKAIRLPPSSSLFREFLFSEERAGPFFISPLDRRRIAYRCLELLDADTKQVPIASSAQKYYLSHWLASLKDHNGDPASLAQELAQFIHSARTAYPKNYLTILSTYACSHRDWISSAGAFRGGELIAYLAPLDFEERTRLGKPLAKALDHLMNQLPDHQDYTIQALWPKINVDPPLPDLPISIYTALFERCTRVLFHSRSRVPVALNLPAKRPENHHYTFGAWCWHMAMAAKYDPEFNREYLLNPNLKYFRVPSVSRLSDPIRYLNSLKDMFRRSGDLKRIVKSLKSSLELGVSTIDLLLAPETFQSYSSSSKYNWRFRYENTPDGIHWAYESAKNDVSVLNMFVGYKAFIECFIMQLEGAHDNTTCAFHIARGRAEEKEWNKV